METIISLPQDWLPRCLSHISTAYLQNTDETVVIGELSDARRYAYAGMLELHTALVCAWIGARYLGGEADPLRRALPVALDGGQASARGYRKRDPRGTPWAQWSRRPRRTGLSGGPAGSESSGPGHAPCDRADHGRRINISRRTPVIVPMARDRNAHIAYFRGRGDDATCKLAPDPQPEPIEQREDDPVGRPAPRCPCSALGYAGGRRARGRDRRRRRGGRARGAGAARPRGRSAGRRAARAVVGDPARHLRAVGR
jgi:hypothetical protein